MSAEFDVSLEDLENRKNQRSTTPDEDRKRCPATGCGSPDIVPINIGYTGGQAHDDADYRCRKCGHAFDQPATGLGYGGESGGN